MVRRRKLLRRSKKHGFQARSLFNFLLSSSMTCFPRSDLSAHGTKTFHCTHLLLPSYSHHSRHGVFKHKGHSAPKAGNRTMDYTWNFSLIVLNFLRLLPLPRDLAPFSVLHYSGSGKLYIDLGTGRFLVCGIWMELCWCRGLRLGKRFEWHGMACVVLGHWGGVGRENVQWRLLLKRAFIVGGRWCYGWCHVCLRICENES